MPKRIIKFDVDLNRQSVTKKFKAKDFENLELHITIKDSNSIFDLTGCTVDFVNDCNTEEIIEVVDNVIKINIVEFDVGIHEAEIVIVNEEGVVKTPSFYFAINKSISGEIELNLKTLLDNEDNILLDSSNYILKVRA